jgi:hypothetical protein
VCGYAYEDIAETQGKEQKNHEKQQGRTCKFPTNNVPDYFESGLRESLQSCL